LEPNLNYMGMNRSNKYFINDLLSVELLNQFNESIKHIAPKILNELCMEPDETGHYVKNIKMDLNRIDEFLSVPEISVDEINRLLDKRSELIECKNKKAQHVVPFKLTLRNFHLTN
jgi:hypothetical protein